MSFKSVLSAIGSDVKKVFAWISSPAGQGVIATGEAAALAIDPALGGFIALANTILTETLKVEALATAAGQQSGSGPQKSAAVIATVTPEVLGYAQKNGLSTPTSEQIQAAVNALVAFGNSFGAKA